MMLISSTSGWLVIFSYTILTFVISLAFSKRVGLTKSYFLLADRNIGPGIAAFSIASTWIWAPALFISAEKAYTHGIVGLFWFTVPNVATLILFGFFAAKMKAKLPEGWSFSDFIRENYSNRVHNLFLIESFGLQILSFSVQILAGASVISLLTGIDFFLITTVLALIPLTYSFISGLRASIVTDLWQMIWIIIVLFISIPLVIKNIDTNSIAKGLGGYSGSYYNFFSKEGIHVFLTFGLPVSIGLISGPFGDQMFWQRVFAMKSLNIKNVFIKAGIIFAIVPLSLSVLGFALAGESIKIPESQLANIEAIIRFTPFWLIFPFIFMILSGLISTADSVICATSSLVGHDLVIRYNEKSKKIIESEKTIVILSRFSMIIVSLSAVVIANIPGIKIIHLFLIYGTLRASVFLPTIFAIKGYKMSEKGLFYGIITSIFIGLPVFAYGNLNGDWFLIVAGSLIAILSSGVFSRLNFKNSK